MKDIKVEVRIPAVYIDPNRALGVVVAVDVTDLFGPDNVWGLVLCSDTTVLEGSTVARIIIAHLPVDWPTRWGDAVATPAILTEVFTKEMYEVPFNARIPGETAVRMTIGDNLCP
jgi:hypothetical protein